MAIYHVNCSIKTGPSQSAVAASAYISGEAIHRDLDGTTKKYGRTERIIDPGGIMTPEHVYSARVRGQRYDRRLGHS